MNANVENREPKSGKFRVGFYVPGVFAAATAVAIEHGRSRAAVIQRVLGLQRQLTMRCCGTQRPCDVFSKAEVGELHDLALKSDYSAFLAEVERRYAAVTVACPDCGCQGHLPVHV